MLLLQNELIEQSIIHVFRTVFVSESSTVKEMFEELNTVIKHVFPVKNWVQLFAVYKPKTETYVSDQFTLEEINLLVLLASFCWNIKEWNKLYEACAIPIDLIQNKITELKNFNQMRSFGYLKKYCYQTANVTISDVLNYILEDHEDCLRVVCMLHTELIYTFQPSAYIELYPFNLDPPTEKELANEKLLTPYDPESFDIQLVSTPTTKHTKSCLRLKRSKPLVKSFVLNHRPKSKNVSLVTRKLPPPSNSKQISWAEDNFKTVFEFEI
jgi:hypothetical protein